MNGFDGWFYMDWLKEKYQHFRRRYRHLVRDPHVLSMEEREALIAAAEERGAISLEEADGLDVADVIVRGQRREGEGEAYAVVEVSYVVHPEDVERAAKRAAALRKALPEAEVLAVVAGPEIHPLAVAAARQRGVWWLTEDRAFAPHEIPEPPAGGSEEAMP